MPRYFADIFDADGRFYVFDALDAGGECAGPFDTLDAAQSHADLLNETS